MAMSLCGSQGIQAVYRPFASLVEGVDPAAASRVNDALAAALESVAPYSPYIGTEQTDLPYSFVTVVQRAPIQVAAYALASELRRVSTCSRVPHQLCHANSPAQLEEVHSVDRYIPTDSSISVKIYLDRLTSGSAVSTLP